MSNVPIALWTSASRNLRHGWYWGTQAFREKLLAMAAGAIRARKSRAYRSAPIKRMHDEKEAERIVMEGLVRYGLEENELSSIPGSDRRKVRIADEVRANTGSPLNRVGEYGGALGVDR